MGTALILPQPGTIAFDEYPELPLGPRQVRLRTLYSGISAGTELNSYRGASPFVNKLWDPSRRLFLPAEGPGQKYPVRSLGYEEVGEVLEVGPEVQAVRLGDLVCGTWGHRTTGIVEEEYAARRILPPGLDPLFGIFSHIGPVALNGIHDAHIRIGETVAIFGLGVPGQIAAQLAVKSGARVIVVDPIDKRLEIAQRLGALDAALNPRDGAPAEAIKDLTRGRGADVCIEISGSYRALHEAVRAAAYSARVVSLGFFQGEAAGLALGEEFHHNRIHLVCSQISGIDPELHYRWDRERLIETILAFLASGALNLLPIITHVLPFQAAAEAFRLLDEHPAEALQVVLDFRMETD
jgi:2-desacetyl-2-hydroxyethyl bacteriochlorophyllide A dehydrogenase